MMSDLIMEFCESIIKGSGGLHDFERCEVAVPVVDRDVAVAAWVIRCLSNAANKNAQPVLEAITEQRKNKQFCEWEVMEEDINAWQGTCGVAWILEDGTPADNGMNYCPRCGRPLRVINEFENGEDEDD